MHSTLKNLPTALPNKEGWPWTEVIDPLPATMSDGQPWPKISIVTPSYNQGEFIEETIRSVLLQGYPNLEYIIIDGGSTDNTVEIIKKYESHINYWVSEPDGGQSHALNKGFRIAKGELIGWQNSDDYYQSRAFELVAIASKIFRSFDVIYGSADNADRDSNYVRAYPVSEFNLEDMIPHLNMCNQSLFFRRRVLNENNLIDESFNHAMDLEFFIRLAIKGYKFKFYPKIKGYYRVHNNAKGLKQYDVYSQDCFQIYQELYENKMLSVKLRNKALNCIRGICLDNFRLRKFFLYRKHVKKSAIKFKFRLLNVELIIKYLASFILR